MTVELDPTVDVTMARLAILERMEALRPELPTGARNLMRRAYVPDDLRESPLLELNVTGPYTRRADQDRAGHARAAIRDARRDRR